MDATDQDDETAVVHDAWRAGWWPAAQALAHLGHDVAVDDPDWPHGQRELWDGREDHGVVVVRDLPGLGWLVLVRETVDDLIDEADADGLVG